MLAVVKQDRDNNAKKACKLQSKTIAGLVEKGYPDNAEDRQVNAAEEPNEDPAMNGMANISEEHY